MFPTSFFAKKNNDQSPSKKGEEPHASSFASIVTPSGKTASRKKKNRVVVKAHTRSIKIKKTSGNIRSNIIKVGTIVSRTFKTWPRSRKPGDPPVPANFHGMVTEVNPKTKKVHVLFENSQNMRLEVSEVLPLIVKKQGSVEDKVPSYLKGIQESRENDVSDLESFSEKTDEYTMDTATVSYQSDNEVEYLGTKEVPDIELIKVVPSNSPYVEEKQTTSDESNTSVTMM